MNQEKLRGTTYFTFVRTIKDLLILQDIDSGPRFLKPVVFKIQLWKKKRFGGFHLNNIELHGHPSEFWHPHIGGQMCGFLAICWGETGSLRCRESRKLKTILDKNLYAAIGLLTSFSDGGFHHSREVLDVWTTRGKPTPTMKKLQGIKPFPDNLWRNTGEVEPDWIDVNNVIGEDEG